ncbi:MAG: cupin domain-containing protein [Clostridia bacterium]|nr:cupin domain-containing protein [Clostridia bacterium]
MDIRKIRDGDETPDEKLLYDLDETETLQLGYVSVDPGESTTLRAHPDEEEIYLILEGEARLLLGNEERIIRKGETVYVPRNTDHFMTCISPNKLEYLYIANYPDLPGKADR